MSNERDELFQLMLGRTTTKAVERILAAGYTKPKRVTTVAELDALPMESVVKSAEGNVWESLVGGWFETCSRACHVASDIALPATVLYSPMVSGE